MFSRTWMRGLLISGGILAAATTANAQLSDDPSPTLAPARYSSDQSPYSASTTPLSSVPEGVTVYYWPLESFPVKPAHVAYTPASYSPTLHGASTSKPVNMASPPTSVTYPVQTTLRPEVSSTVQYPAGSLQCVCTPVGQISQISPPTGASPTVVYGPSAGYAPVGSYPPMYSYRPAMPVSALPGDYYFGRGLIGQPKVYVPGQPLRNTLRFLTP